ncbi:MAG: hypothetical protein KDH15_15750 [Rhodocyclaceae bacterium]|nr:hypothetical protein [Rhodocyclaceae bacterium]
MAKTPAPTTTPAPAAAVAGQSKPPKRDAFRHLNCKDWGKGGQFIERDGKRVPVDPPKPAAPAAHQE